MEKGGEALTADDTVVMGNLGYFQVRGSPGLYDVGLKAGLSNDTFETSNMNTLQVSSYITPPYQVRVKTRPGRSPEDLFEEGSKKGRGLPGPRGKTGGQGTFSRLFGGLASMMGGKAQESGGGSPA